jgi:hypothetical protein
MEKDKHSVFGEVLSKLINDFIENLECGLAGGCASVFTDTIYFPLDSIKTRLQVLFLEKYESM